MIILLVSLAVVLPPFSEYSHAANRPTVVRLPQVLQGETMPATLYKHLEPPFVRGRRGRDRVNQVDQEI